MVIIILISLLLCCPLSMKKNYKQCKKMGKSRVERACALIELTKVRKQDCGLVLCMLQVVGSGAQSLQLGPAL